MSTDTVLVEELPIPRSMDTPEAAAFTELIDIGNLIETQALGTDALTLPARQLLSDYQAQEDHPVRIFVARADGRIVGTGHLSWQPEDDATVTWAEVEVLPQYRRRGIGTALLDHLTTLALASGRPTLQAAVIHSRPGGGERVEAPTGFGWLSDADPGVRFLLARGYRLEQVARISALPLPVDPELLAAKRAAAQAAAGDDYRIVGWTGPTPADRVDDLVTLMARMSTDIPTAALETTDEQWDAARLARVDDLLAATGRTRLTVAAEHVPTGRLAGHNVLVLPRDRSRPVIQEDTLVLSEHRGHRLGMLLKVANLQRLAELSPSSTLVTTFNAEENRHMLDVNEAVGFAPIGYEGCWQLTP
ncbi:GNAT family N-acetyltransferase [Jiangella alba]|uniref:Acetyltransferase (GNAT) domain-containing protein n=1 Tax=Jiangella alba TaxID=561176 RepID=A0A1H5JN32_9ACTN|nr:GNAT family N-acetyltransferase [Jiangella alba]SEE53371.1 Acetyltransferase (GNAT) domain-containing protein [Jiangella alba]